MMSELCTLLVSWKKWSHQQAVFKNAPWVNIGQRGWWTGFYCLFSLLSSWHLSSWSFFWLQAVQRINIQTFAFISQISLTTYGETDQMFWEEEERREGEECLSYPNINNCIVCIGVPLITSWIFSKVRCSRVDYS